MYKINLYNNFYLYWNRCHIKYDVNELENDINEKVNINKSDAIYDIFNEYFFILTEEKALYFKTKYNQLIKSIEEIEENDDE